MILEELSVVSSGHFATSGASQQNPLICRGSFSRQCDFISPDLKELIRSDVASEIFLSHCRIHRAEKSSSRKKRRTFEFRQRVRLAKIRCYFPFFDVTCYLQILVALTIISVVGTDIDWSDEHLKDGKHQQLERKNNQCHRSLLICFWSTTGHRCSDSSTAELRAVIPFGSKAFLIDFFNSLMNCDSILTFVLFQERPWAELKATSSAYENNASNWLLWCEFSVGKERAKTLSRFPACFDKALEGSSAEEEQN